MDDLQFYPTPRLLANRAWAKFKNRDFSRVLEPSAGDGALIKTAPKDGWERRRFMIDACEIDIAKHPLIESNGSNVVGLDFLKFKAGAIYSHCIMNPPFAEGAKHVLHAWNILEDAEIVAILNAETIRNPYSAERQMLVSLIEKHGEVEFIKDAFNGPDAIRKTDVEIALIWLEKRSESLEKDLIGDILDKLKTEKDVDIAYTEMHDIALPESFVENAVRAYDAAVLAVKEVIVAEARANRYRSILGQTFAEVRGEEGATHDPLHTSKKWVKESFAKEVDDLKDRAWTGILTSTQVSSRLSSKAQKRLEAEFERIKKLEFTVENIYGFLCGLVEKQGDIQIQMACDVFDEITKYHTDNTVYYMGWKSNDKHRTCGRRIKTTRFVLPGFRTESWRYSLDWDAEKLLTDFDRVFAMLDGKTEPGFGLMQAFRHCFNDLRNGKRISTSYFDVRYYPGRGTVHFFPKSKALIDRLNRLVGRHRQWLPPEDARVPEEFWLQYDKAEKFDKDFHSALSKTYRNYWDHPILKISYGSESEREIANQRMVQAMAATLEKHGIDPDFRLEKQPEAPALPAPINIDLFQMAA